jgi:hypothetical protein
VGLRPLVSWNRGFDSRWGHECLSVVSVVCCHIEVSASDWSFLRWSPKKRGVSECDREAWIMRRPWSTRVCCAMRKKGVLRKSADKLNTALKTYSVTFLQETV